MRSLLLVALIVMIVAVSGASYKKYNTATCTGTVTDSSSAPINTCVKDKDNSSSKITSCVNGGQVSITGYTDAACTTSAGTFSLAAGTCVAVGTESIFIDCNSAATTGFSAVLMVVCAFFAKKMMF
jgi:hypothetical protein